MPKPLNSVLALARFSFDERDQAHALRELKGVNDWRQWLEQIESHGLSGYANKHIAEYDLPVPVDVRMSLKALSMRHKSAAKARYQVMAEMREIFAANELPFVALKGAALMPYLYGEPQLRPMRDMDVLLPLKAQSQAAQCLRDIGFDLPQEQPNKYMRDMHQQPNATKKVSGFLCSVELHSDGFSREVPGHFRYPEQACYRQTIVWDDIEFQALDDITMLHQVSKHLEALHPDSLLKLINVMDVIGLAEQVLKKGQWMQLQAQHPHVINTLRCLHFLTPLPPSLQVELHPLANQAPSGVGEIMESIREMVAKPVSLLYKCKLLLLPSDWWMHLYYNIDPGKSLWWVKCVRHPLRVSHWLFKRVYSRLMGG